MISTRDFKDDSFYLFEVFLTNFLSNAKAIGTKDTKYLRTQMGL